MICKLVSNQNEQIKFIQDITYYWHFKEDSITRINNAQYSYDQSFVGYTENMIYAVKYAEKSSEKEKSLYTIKLLGSSLLIGGIVCLIYFQVNQENFIGSPGL